MIAAIHGRKDTEQNGFAREQKMAFSYMNVSACLAAFVTAVALGCSTNGPSSGERNIEDVTSFFADRARFGMSPDAGLYKFSDPRGQWDHVATFHGMADDVGLCESTVRALRETQPQERYICRLLNQ